MQANQQNQEKEPNKQNQGQDLIPILLALAAGVAIGMNWPKINKYLAPYIATLKEKGGDTYANFIRTFADKKGLFYGRKKS